MTEHAKRRTEAFAKFDELIATLNGVEVIFRDKDGFLLKLSAPSITYLLSYIDVVIEKIEDIGFSCLDQTIDSDNCIAQLPFTFDP